MKAAKNTKTNNQTYTRNHRQIRAELHKALAGRRINLRVSEICQSVEISSPTFYSHCRGVEDALRNYEEELEAEFLEMLPQGARRQFVFSALLIFVHQHRSYFSATFRNHDFYLLTRLLTAARSKLANATTSTRSFLVYIGHIETIILCWGRCDQYAPEKIPRYTQKLLQTRLMHSAN